jgi:hypothetical protein
MAFSEVHDLRLGGVAGPWVGIRERWVGERDRHVGVADRHERFAAFPIQGRAPSASSDGD